MTKKKVTITLFLCMFICLISAQIIDQITDITLNRQVLEFDEFTGSIAGYGDRLFVNSTGRMQEFKINEDGSLERLSVYQRGGIFRSPIIVKDKKLYNIYNTANSHFMMIFDLTTSPMTYIKTIETPFIPPRSLLPYVWNDYILIGDDISKTHKFNTTTLSFDGWIETRYPALSYGNPMIDSYITTFWLMPPTNQLLLRFYDLSIDDPFGFDSASPLQNYV